MLLAAIILAESHGSASSGNGKHTASPSLVLMGFRYSFILVLLLVAAAVVLQRTSQGQRVAVWIRSLPSNKRIGRSILWLLTVASEYTPETVNLSWILFFHMEFGSKMVRGLQSGNARDMQMVVHRLRQLARYYLIEDIGRELHRYERADKRQLNPRPPRGHRTFGCWFLRELVEQAGSALDLGSQSFVEGIRDGGWATDPAVLRNNANPLDVQGRTLLRLLTLCPAVASRAVAQHRDILSAAATMLEMNNGSGTSKEDEPDDLFVLRCDEVFGVLGNLAMSGDVVVKEILDLKVVSLFASLLEEPWFGKKLSGSPLAKGTDAVLNAAARLLCALSRSTVHHMELVEQRAVVALHTLVEMASTVTCAPALRHATLTVYYLSEIESTVSEIRRRGQERLVLRMRTKLHKVCPEALGPDWANRQRKRVVSFFQTSAMPPKAAARAAAAAAAQANANSSPTCSSPAHPDSFPARGPPPKPGVRNAGPSNNTGQQPGKRSNSSRSAKGGGPASGVKGGANAPARGGRRGKQSPKTSASRGMGTSLPLSTGAGLDPENASVGGEENGVSEPLAGVLPEDREGRNGEMAGADSGPRSKRLEESGDGDVRVNNVQEELASASPRGASSGDEESVSESGSETESSRSGSEGENAPSSGSSGESAAQPARDLYRSRCSQKDEEEEEKHTPSIEAAPSSSSRGGKGKSMNGEGPVGETPKAGRAGAKDGDPSATTGLEAMSPLRTSGNSPPVASAKASVAKEPAPCKEVAAAKKSALKAGRGSDPATNPMVAGNAADVLRPDTPPLAPRAPKKPNMSEKQLPTHVPPNASRPALDRTESAHSVGVSAAPQPKLPQVSVSTRQHTNTRNATPAPPPAAVHTSLARPMPAPSLFSRGLDAQLVRPTPSPSTSTTKGLTKIPFPSPVVPRALTPLPIHSHSSPPSTDPQALPKPPTGSSSLGEELEERLMRTLLESPKPWVAGPTPSMPDSIASSLGTRSLSDVSTSAARFPSLPSATSLWLPDITSPPLRSDTGTPPSPLWAFHPTPTPPTRLMSHVQPLPNDLTQLDSSDELDNSFLPSEFPFTPDPPGSEPLNLHVLETPSTNPPPPPSSFLPWASGGSFGGLGSSSMEASSSLFGLSSGGMMSTSVSTGLGGSAFNSYFPFTAPVFSSEDPHAISGGAVFSPVVGSGRSEHLAGARNVTVATPLPDNGELDSGFICSPTQPSSQYVTDTKDDSRPICGLPGCGRRQKADGERLSKCSRCFSALYCSKECQRQHWSTHKLVCKKNP